MTIFSIQDFTCTDLGHRVLESSKSEHDLNDDERQVLTLIAQYPSSTTEQQRQLHLQFDSMYEYVNLTRLVVLKMLDFNGVPHIQSPNIEKNKLINLNSAMTVLSSYHSKSEQVNNSTSTHTNKTNRSIYSDTAITAHSIVHTINAMASQTDMHLDSNLDDDSLFESIVQDVQGSAEQSSILEQTDGYFGMYEDSDDLANAKNNEQANFAQPDINIETNTALKNQTSENNTVSKNNTISESKPDIDPMLRFVAEFTKDS